MVGCQGVAGAVGFARFAMAVRDLLGVRGVRGAVYQICRGLIECEVTGVSGQG